LTEHNHAMRDDPVYSSMNYVLAKQQSVTINTFYKLDTHHAMWTMNCQKHRTITHQQEKQL